MGPAPPMPSSSSGGRGGSVSFFSITAPTRFQFDHRYQNTSFPASTEVNGTVKLIGVSVRLMFSTWKTEGTAPLKFRLGRSGLGSSGNGSGAKKQPDADPSTKTERLPSAVTQRRNDRRGRDTEKLTDSLTITAPQSSKSAAPAAAPGALR